MKLKGLLKVTGKSLFKVARVAVVGAASVAVAHGPEAAQILSQFDPKAAAVFTLAYTLLDAYKHREKINE